MEFWGSKGVGTLSFTELHDVKSVAHNQLSGSVLCLFCVTQDYSYGIFSILLDVIMVALCNRADHYIFAL